MSTQSEYQLENELIQQLQGLGYTTVTIKNESQLLSNLKTQIERANSLAPLSETEWKQVISFLNAGTIFERAKNLRDQFPVKFDDGSSKHIFFLSDDPSKNLYQVTNQITVDHRDHNGRTSRFDVTLLVNGLPLVQIELKKRGMEIAEAFNQTQRYTREAYWVGQGLFGFIQLFIISNGANTRYYSNGTTGIEFAFPWADVSNKHINEIVDFADAFLNHNHLTQMLTQYMVMLETSKSLMVLRPYQIYAVQKIIAHVQNSQQNGYIWHTTGSGKTLTSFKASQIVMDLPEVYKVVFVVDRKDLDYQTTKEFNSFSKGSIDGTNNTNTLVNQLADQTKLIVTTIQKLNTAISKTNYLNRITHLKDQRIVFIFDECHRSQFGKTHDDIKNFFTASQMFGFTGTPIFEENAGSNEFGKRTTAMLFEKCLHKYVITNAIKDENVLKFSIEYISTFKRKDEILDIEVEAIDEAEVMEAPQRLNNIVDYIITNHSRKTHNKLFTGMFCVSSVETLIKYYQLFHQKKQEGLHNLKVATIFSYAANEDDAEAKGLFIDDEFSEENPTELLIAAEPKSSYNSKHSREYLDDFISHYNKEFNTNYSTRDSQSFYNYYNDIAKRVKNKDIDILLVVNMFLTGFDSKTLNTLYVDKNLKYHGLIQAYSRTNRILDEVKSQGNIVCFRNLKSATDDAIQLFSNLDAKEIIIMQPYEDYVKLFDEAFANLLEIAPTVDSVNGFLTEEQELEFVTAFRELMRLKNKLITFTEFSFDNLQMEEQTFEDYKSKYLDLYDKTKSENAKELVSILDDIDFELELIHRDEVNVSYIMKLLAQLKEETSELEHEKQKQRIIDIIAGETQLRSKRELIERFINNHLPQIEDTDLIEEKFDEFLVGERKVAIENLSSEENLNQIALEQVIGNYLFTNKTPLRDEIIATMQQRPSLKERASTTERITNKIINFVETFISGFAG